MILPNGTEIIDNTFWLDFSIAERFGVEEIKDTYKRALDEWKKDIRYMTALAITLNHKSWSWSDKNNDELTDLYVKLWREIDEYILDYTEDDSEDGYHYNNFTSEEISYYVRATD